jgi:hypothetical protein
MKWFFQIVGLVFFLLIIMTLINLSGFKWAELVARMREKSFGGETRGKETVCKT